MAESSGNSRRRKFPLGARDGAAAGRWVVPLPLPCNTRSRLAFSLMQNILIVVSRKWARDILFVHTDINLNIGLGTNEVLVEQSPAHFDILHHVLNLSVIFPGKKKGKKKDTFVIFTNSRWFSR